MDVAADHPVPQCQAHVDGAAGLSGAVRVHLVDGIDQRGKTQPFSAALGRAAFRDSGFLLRGHGSIVRLVFSAAAEAVLDVVVQDEIQLFRSEPIVPRQHCVNFVDHEFCQSWPKLLIADCAGDAV